jgi:SAM-dependent methyltransferase
MQRDGGPLRLFSDRHESYARFIRAVRYPQGLRAFFAHDPALRGGLRILDAGCGTGALTLAVLGALERRGLQPRAMHAFDLTPAMLEHFRRVMERRGIGGVATALADVLTLEALPAGWTDYDLVVTASMLEYVPRARFAEALAGLRARLRADGRLVLFITRRNWLTRPLIGRWWQSNLYSRAELREAFLAAGFSRAAFPGFPAAGKHLSVWGHVVDAAR